MRPGSGLLVAFEGGEGSGKTTQAKLLSDRLRAAGHGVTLTRQPGGTDEGVRIRDILLDTDSDIDPVAEAMLYAADRAQHVARVIRPALELGHVVITDRYVDSTMAYQGAGRRVAFGNGMSGGELWRLNRMATGGLYPDATFVLDLPRECAAGRLKEEPDRIEAEGYEFHQRVRDEFLQIARSNRLTHKVIDALLPPEEITRVVMGRLQPLLDKIAK